MSSTSRRRFLQGSVLAAGALAIPSCQSLGGRSRKQPGEKLNLGVIGVGGRGGANLHSVTSENIIALCDVDERRLERAGGEFPDAQQFVDFRDLLDLGGLDAVVISTPDHTHAAPAAMALRRGLDVYCEKPLTHTVVEARLLQTLAEKQGAVTQMGTQIHALPNYRRVVELVQSGAIGPVREVHVFVNGTNWGGGRRPVGSQEVPPGLNWDLWLGPAAWRPYHDGYHPANWRRFWAFGGGTMADMACHYMDLAFWALELRHPETVQAFGPDPDRETAPRGLTVKYRFPARGELPAVDFTWYDGENVPSIKERYGVEGWRNGVLFVGDDGWLIADYNNRELGPAERFADFQPPAPFIADSIGHHREWIEACKTRARTTCDFAYSGTLTQAVLLGCVSFRAGGAKLTWDGELGEASGSLDALAFMHRQYRDGWVL